MSELLADLGLWGLLFVAVAVGCVVEWFFGDDWEGGYYDLDR